MMESFIVQRIRTMRLPRQPFLYEVKQIGKKQSNKKAISEL